jgi:hypothetical protein
MSSLAEAVMPIDKANTRVPGMSNIGEAFLYHGVFLSLEDEPARSTAEPQVLTRVASHAAAYEIDDPSACALSEN